MTKDSGTALILESGATEYTKTKNIYDLAGNVREMTAYVAKVPESYGGYIYVMMRGGRADDLSTSSPSKTKVTYGEWPEYQYANYLDAGFRIRLYMK